MPAGQLYKFASLTYIIGPTSLNSTICVFCLFVCLCVYVCVCVRFYVCVCVQDSIFGNAEKIATFHLMRILMIMGWEEEEGGTWISGCK